MFSYTTFFIKAFAGGNPCLASAAQNFTRLNVCGRVFSDFLILAPFSLISKKYCNMLTNYVKGSPKKIIILLLTFVNNGGGLERASSIKKP